MSDEQRQTSELEAVQALVEQGQYRDAIAPLNLLLTQLPHNATAHKLKGDCLMALQFHAESLGSYDQAIALSPFEPEFWYARGQLFEAMGAYGNAVENYDGAIRLSADPQYQAAKSQIYRQQKLRSLAYSH